MAGVALITGAGSGLGRRVAERLAARGLGVALVGRRRPPLEETAAGLPDALVAPADVREPDAVRAALAAVVARWGRLDVVVNCAALLAGPAPQGVGPWEHFSCVLRTNVLGPALVAEEAVAVMRPGGVIVHVGSSAADLPTPDALAYGASKAALAHLVASQAVRYAPRRVRVVGVAPGGLHDRPEGGISPMDSAAEAVIYLSSRYGAHFDGVMLRPDRGEVVRRGRPPG